MLLEEYIRFDDLPKPQVFWRIDCMVSRNWNIIISHR